MHDVGAEVVHDVGAEVVHDVVEDVVHDAGAEVAHDGDEEVVDVQAKCQLVVISEDWKALRRPDEKAL